jgi:DNA invertase Pin-like site-specific DNA recombinase
MQGVNTKKLKNFTLDAFLVYRSAKRPGGDMTLEQIIEHFGGVSQTARALDVTRQTIYNWQNSGGIPESRRQQAQYLIAIQKTGGKLDG